MLNERERNVRIVVCRLQLVSGLQRERWCDPVRAEYFSGRFVPVCIVVDGIERGLRREKISHICTSGGRVYVSMCRVWAFGIKFTEEDI